MGDRLTQNYITEENIRAKEVPGLEDLEEVGRLQFRGQFKAGTDESHRQFIVNDDTRETYETWEACLAEGVRTRQVEPEVPSRVATLHEQSLTEGRDILDKADPEEKKKWLARDGQDWSGAFGENPKAYVDSNGKMRAEPGKDAPVHDPIDPSDNDDHLDDDDSDSDSDDLGVKDASNTDHGALSAGRPSADGSGVNGKEARELNKRSEKRKHRGLLQWKPMRNADFAKDQTKFSLRRVKNKLTGGLTGREPDVETEA
jgi:hypothetical protein